MVVYLFDFDGTLVDSMPAYSEAMIRLLNESGVEYPDDIIKTITPLGYLNTARHFSEVLGMEGSVEQIVEKIKSYLFNAYLYEIQAKDSVKMVLERLYERGDSLNVLTASPHNMLDPCLKRVGLYDLFDNVWSCDDFNTTKSNPEIYKMVAEKLAVKVKDIIFLDDNLDADTTAKNAGAIVYGVYDSSSDEYVDKIKSVTDKYIVNFKELL